MLDEALSLAVARGLPEFEFHCLKAEDLPAGLGTFRLITFGASYHRVHQARVLETAYDMLEPRGGLALLFPAVPWRGDTEWKAALRTTVQKWTGTTLGGPFEPAQNDVARSRFGICEVRDVVEAHVWSADELLGFMHSTSFCSPGMLGERADAFDSDLASVLRAVQPDGRFSDLLETTVVLARKD
jgi:SAM-dependent methyltransferase